MTSQASSEITATQRALKLCCRLHANRHHLDGQVKLLASKIDEIEISLLLSLGIDKGHGQIENTALELFLVGQSSRDD